MTPGRARALVAGTVLVLMVVAAACGDDPSDEGVPAGGATTAAPATTAAAGATTAAAAAATTAVAQSTTTTTTIATASGQATIVAIDFSFKPQNIKVTVGTKVTWTNNDSTTHQIVSKGDPFPGDGTIDPNESYSVTFDKPGTYDYFCGIHNSMTGSIVVS
ncbi:MAG TPA: cupredoxin domain-containing protein [Acidimicrobiales bacterium]|nr:cupredoxin domain-containing protein [Acidimicrobiales bacterium]